MHVEIHKGMICHSPVPDICHLKQPMSWLSSNSYIDVQLSFHQPRDKQFLTLVVRVQALGLRSSSASESGEQQSFGGTAWSHEG